MLNEYKSDLNQTQQNSVDCIIAQWRCEQNEERMHLQMNIMWKGDISHPFDVWLHPHNDG